MLLAFGAGAAVVVAAGGCGIPGRDNPDQIAIATAAAAAMAGTAHFNRRDQFGACPPGGVVRVTADPLGSAGDSGTTAAGSGSGARKTGGAVPSVWLMVARRFRVTASGCTPRSSFSASASVR